MDLPYRKSVIAVITDGEGCYLAGERSDQPGAWQLPQGGIDSKETAQEALFRELREEIGTDQVQVIREAPYEISYDFPDDVRLGLGATYRGQQQIWFLVKFHKGGRPDLSRADGEFSQLKWLSLAEIVGGIISWKREAYEAGIKALQLKI